MLTRLHTRVVGSYTFTNNFWVRPFAALILALILPGLAHAGAIIPGFNSNTIPRNDDGSTSSAVALGFDVDFYGVQASSVWVNNNGNVTFDGPLGTYTPFPMNSTAHKMIAPFFADVDTRGIGQPVTYGQGMHNGRLAFGVNWIDVGHYNQMGPLNSFQLIMVDRSDTGAGNFDFIFNYNSILWETGTASGGSGLGLGGSSARVGFTNGSDVNWEMAGSAVNGALLDNGINALIHGSLDCGGVEGCYVFTVRNGSVITPTPEPSSMLMLGAGVLSVGLRIWRRRRSS